MDVEAAVRYPLQGEDATRTLLIGGGLVLLGAVINFVAALLLVVFVGALLFPLALIPQILIQGYLVRVLRSTVAGEAEPPVFDEWADLGIDGLRLVAVAIVYSIPVVVAAVVLTAVLVGVTAVTAGGAGDAGAMSGVALAVVVVGMLLVVLLLLPLAYLMPVGLCAMVQEGEVSAAFDLSRLRRVGGDRDYAVAWGVGVAVMLVGGMVGQMLGILLIGFPIAFAAQVAGFRLFALGYGESLGLDVDQEPSSDADEEASAPLTDVGGETPTPVSGDADEPSAPPSPLSEETTADRPSDESTTGESTDESTTGESTDESTTDR